MAFTFAVYTLGCKVNYYESTAISEALTENGLTECDFDSVCDVYIINTCAVTAESERKAGQMIRRARKQNPSAFVAVTGCMAQISPERAALAGADFVCGNREKLLTVKAVLDFTKGNAPKEQVVRRSELCGAPFEKMSIKRSDRTRAYMKVGDGCDSSCAYCVIKNARGPVRSKPLSDAISEAKALIASGYREIVLTAIEISAYGKDLGNTDLADLICSIGSLEGLERLRLGSVDPAILKEPFIKSIASCKTLAPHFHLSLQSGCDKTLRAMQRRYNTDMIKQGVSLIREYFPDAMLTADIIVGFPGETAEDFLTSAELIASLGLLHAHIFTFSSRPGTKAESMPDQVSKQEKNRRSAQLTRLCNASRDAVLEKYIGRVLPVLFEEQKDGICYGHTASFIEVALPHHRSLHGQTVNVRLLSNSNGVMLAELV